MLTDSHNRAHNYLRISLTDNCNLRCFYCMPDEDYAFTPASGLMQVSEIEAIAGIFVKEGVSKIRLMTNNPRKRAGLEGYGLEIVENVPIEVDPNPHNQFYLQTKRDKLGHEILK